MAEENINNSRKKKTPNVKVVLMCVSRYALFLIAYIGLFVSFSVTIPEKYNTPVADIIISMLPMIFIIIKIALSLPSEKIYGIPAKIFEN